MKKLILAASVLAIASAPVLAQDYSAPPPPPGYGRQGIDVRKLRFGVFVAPTIAYMKPTTSQDDKSQYSVSNNGSKVGFLYGLMVDYQFAPNYALVTGLDISDGGGKILAQRSDGAMGEGTIERADFNYSLNYLQIPLAFKLRTDDYSGFRGFFQLGLSLGFNLSKKASYTVDYIANSRDTSVSETNVRLKGTLAAAPVNLEMNIGIGTEYTLNDRLKAYAGIFFNNGFLPDATNPGNYELAYPSSSTFHDGNTRLNNFALRVGLFF